MIRYAPILDPGAFVALDFFGSVAAVFTGGFFYSLVDMTGRVSSGLRNYMVWVRCAVIHKASVATGAGGMLRR